MEVPPLATVLPVLAKDLETLARMLRGGNTVNLGGTVMPVNEAAARIAEQTAARIRILVAAAPKPISHPVSSGSHWQDIRHAGDKDALIAGRYANGRWYVAKGVRNSDGSWIGHRANPPTHFMPMPQPPLEDSQTDRPAGTIG